MRENWRIISLSVVSFLILAAIGIYLKTQDKPEAPLYSSPSAVRPWAAEEWTAAMHPPKPNPAWKPSTSSSVYKVSEINDEIVIQYTEEKHDGYIADIQLKHVDLSSPDAPLQLDFLSCCYVNSEEPIIKHSVKVANRFFDRNANTLNEDQISALKIEEHLQHRWIYKGNFHWPLVGARLQLNKDYKNPKWDNIEVFDQSTQVGLSQGMQWQTEGPLNFRSHLHVWHNADITCVADLFHGEFIHATLTPNKLTTTSIQNSQIHLLGVFAGGQGNSFGTSTSKRYYSIDKSETEKCLVLLEVSATSLSGAFSFSATNKANQEISCWAADFNDGFALLEVKCPADQLATIKLSYRPQHTRFIIPLGKIPGLPEENNNINDLLDVTIPYISANASADIIHEIISDAAQLKNSHSTEFKRYHTEQFSITPRQVIESSEVSTKQQFSIDQTTWKLEVKSSKSDSKLKRLLTP